MIAELKFKLTDDYSQHPLNLEMGMWRSDQSPMTERTFVGKQINLSKGHHLF